MQDRVNKFKPITKKEISQMINQTQLTMQTQNSKVSSNSQNKPFTRKPVVKRHGFVSPNAVKKNVVQNQETKSPCVDVKNRKGVQKSDSHSDLQYWQHKEKSLLNNKITIKRYPSNNQQNIRESQNIYSNKAIKQAYFGNDMHALTEAGQAYKNQGNQSDNSEKDLYFGQSIKKGIKENIVANSINLTNSKKVTRTQYFHPSHINEEIRSSTSRSLKQKQINFNQLKKMLNNNSQAYVQNLEENIRKLQKQNYAVNKKCKWMHEEVEMHLEKQHLMEAQKKGFQVEINGKNIELINLKNSKQQLQKQVIDLKNELQKRQNSIKNKSFKDVETISSLKSFCNKIQQKSNVRQNKVDQIFKGYYGNSPSSIERNKKLSFKTYPGVCSPKKKKDQQSKSSSICGNESFQGLGQSSILIQKSNLKSQQYIQRLQYSLDEIRKQRDKLKQNLESLNQQFTRLNQQIADLNQKLNQKNQIKSKQHEQTLHSQQQQINQLKNSVETLKDQKKNLQNSTFTLIQKNNIKIEDLNCKIKQLQDQIFHQVIKHQHVNIAQSKDFLDENPLQYFLEKSDDQISSSESSERDHLEHQNKSLRLYIQKILQHYKYVKIENRMLLKIKQDLQRIERQKKQIKEERDLFKKKLLETVTNKNNLQKSKNHKRLMDFQSQSSQDEQSAVFELSQSEILQNESDVKQN